MTNVSFNRQMAKVMTIAWNLVKHNQYTMSEALKISWHLHKIKTKMRIGEVHFSYKKTDGSIREALGTLNLNMIPQDASTFTGNYTKNPDQVRYYDIESRGWRSFNIYNLI